LQRRLCERHSTHFDGYAKRECNECVVVRVRTNWADLHDYLDCKLAGDGYVLLKLALVFDNLTLRGGQISG